MTPRQVNVTENVVLASFADDRSTTTIDRHASPMTVIHSDTCNETPTLRLGLNTTVTVDGSLFTARLVVDGMDVTQRVVALEAAVPQCTIVHTGKKRPTPRVERQSPVPRVATPPRRRQSRRVHRLDAGVRQLQPGVAAPKLQPDLRSVLLFDKQHWLYSRPTDHQLVRYIKYPVLVTIPQLGGERWPGDRPCVHSHAALQA